MSEHLHTRVSIPGANVGGYLRYVGPIDGKMGVFGGVELMGPMASSRGKNSGEVDGKYYFSVQVPHTGLFLPYLRLVKANVHLETASSGSRTSSRTQSRNASRTQSPRINETPSPSGRNRFLGGVRSASPTHGPHVTLGASRRSVVERSTSLPSSTINNTPTTNGNPTSTSIGGNGSAEYSKLRKEYDELKRIYEDTKKDMDEKLTILEELQLTVNELQPVLEEYEYDLAEKDKRFQRQKLEFEKARDEWRQSIDLMVAAQQENEELYERRIDELESRLGNSRSSREVDSSIVRELETEISQLKEDNARLRAHMDSGSNLVPVNQDELEKSRKQIDSLEGEIEKLLNRIGQLEDNNTQISKSHLTENLGSMSLKEDSKEKDELIERLQHELEMRPTFEELSELQKSLDELDELHITELDQKNQEIATLKARISSLEQEKSVAAASSIKSTTSNVPDTANVPVDIATPDALPIYKPTTPIDPSAGREDWCGLCERSGHSSIDCPYENDMF